ncbi:MAG TPA: hypothetical protein VK524_05290 [Polyangiaceae bacterium]|nr:hypothetical protein [Polyangiaceae bacterium]
MSARIRRAGAVGVSLVLASALLAAAACSDDDDEQGNGGRAGTAGRGGSSGNGGASGNSGTAGSAGTGGGGGDFRCGDTVCPPVSSTAAEFVEACCTQGSNKCGLVTPLGDSCMELNQPGSLDPTCPAAVIAEGFSLRGCCRTNGVCGVSTAQIGLGCIDLPVDGRAPASCTYDPTNTCTALAEVPCDGPEDCSGGQVCCGRYNGGPYDRFECRTSCESADSGVTQWFEMCHPGQTCTIAGYTCRTSQFLPSYLYRCYTDGTEAVTPGNTAASQVNCGSEPCAAGQSCCWRAPGEPYCVQAGQCRCNQPSDGGAEAGNGDASTDASSDAS